MATSPEKSRLRNVAFKTTPDIQRRLRTEADCQADRLGLGGAELRGSNHLLNRMVREFLDVSEAERNRRIDVGLAIERAEPAGTRSIPARGGRNATGIGEGGEGYEVLRKKQTKRKH